MQSTIGAPSARRYLGSSYRSATAIIISSLGLGCATSVETTAALVETAALPAGHGEVVGTILLSPPAGSSGSDDEKIINSLRAKRYEATMGRFVVHDYGIASRVEHPGDRYKVSFSIGVEQPFVVRAPAGSYSIQSISSTVSTVIGPQLGGCRIEGIANFEIREGQTIYVGRLSMVTEFKPDRGRKMIQMLSNLGRMPVEHPEATLDMTVSAIDLKDDGLQKLGIDESEQRARIDTELMFVDGRKNWDCVSDPPPAPPGAS